MVNVTTRYIVYTHSGGGVRHHHFSTQNDIIEQADGTATTGDHVPALGFPFQSYHGSIVPFAFMSVHGAADGNHLYTSPGNQDVTVGDTDVAILVVYAPPGGIGANGGPGIWVDAFNVDTGWFSDSDFIWVYTPPTPPDTLDGPKTTYANQEGVVSSVAAEHLRAYPSIDGADFLEWQTIVPTPAISSDRDFDLAKNESGEIRFAFYQTQDRAPFGRVPDIFATAMGAWVNDDYCGTPWPHKIGPRGQVEFQLTVDKETVGRLSPAEREKLDSYVKRYPAAAATAYRAMQGVSAILRGAQAIVAKAKRR